MTAVGQWRSLVYSGQHRSMLETDWKLAGLDSLNPSVKPNADGSYTMWFGPQAAKGHEGNWIQTMPGKIDNVLLRLYGPLQPWFDKTWKPGDFEPVKRVDDVAELERLVVPVGRHLDGPPRLMPDIMWTPLNGAAAESAQRRMSENNE